MPAAVVAPLAGARDAAPTPHLLTRRDLADRERYVRIASVPVLDVHELGNPDRDIDEDDLALLLENTRARCDRGDFPLLLAGHTIDDFDAPERDQPEMVGVSDNYRIADYRSAPCLYCDFYVRRDKLDTAIEYPNRSVERIRSGSKDEYNYIENIALLRRPPQRDLGRLTYRRDDHPGLTTVRYARDMPPLLGTAAGPAPANLTSPPQENSPMALEGEDIQHLVHALVSAQMAAMKAEIVPAIQTMMSDFFQSQAAMAPPGDAGMGAPPPPGMPPEMGADDMGADDMGADDMGGMDESPDEDMDMDVEDSGDVDENNDGIVDAEEPPPDDLERDKNAMAMPSGSNTFAPGMEKEKMACDVKTKKSGESKKVDYRLQKLDGAITLEQYRRDLQDKDNRIKTLEAKAAASEKYARERSREADIVALRARGYDVKVAELLPEVVDLGDADYASRIAFIEKYGRRSAVAQTAVVQTEVDAEVDGSSVKIDDDDTRKAIVKYAMEHNIFDRGLGYAREKYFADKGKSATA